MDTTARKTTSDLPAHLLDARSVDNPALEKGTRRRAGAQSGARGKSEFMYRDELQRHSNVVMLVFLHVVKRPVLNCFVLLNTSLKTHTCQASGSSHAARRWCCILKQINKIKKILKSTLNDFYN